MGGRIGTCRSRHSPQPQQAHTSATAHPTATPPTSTTARKQEEGTNKRDLVMCAVRCDNSGGAAPVLCGRAGCGDSGTERPEKRRSPLGPLYSGATRPLDVGLQQTNREQHHGPYAGNGHCRASVLASERLDAKSWRSHANYLCSPSSSSPPFTHAQLGFWGLLSARILFKIAINKLLINY